MSKYVCNCGESFEHHEERTLHLGTCNGQVNSVANFERLLNSIDTGKFRGATSSDIENLVQAIKHLSARVKELENKGTFYG